MEAPFLVIQASSLVQGYNIHHPPSRSFNKNAKDGPGWWIMDQWYRYNTYSLRRMFLSLLGQVTWAGDSHHKDSGAAGSRLGNDMN